MMQELLHHAAAQQLQVPRSVGKTRPDGARCLALLPWGVRLSVALVCARTEKPDSISATANPVDGESGKGQHQIEIISLQSPYLSPLSAFLFPLP